MTSDVIEDNNIQLTLENVIDALGQTNVEFAMSLFDRCESEELATTTDNIDQDNDDSESSLNVREYAYYHVLHQLDTSFETNARAKRLRLRRESLQWSTFPSSSADAVVQFTSDRHLLLDEKPHINVVNRLLRQWRQDARPPTALPAMALLNVTVDGAALLNDANDCVVDALRRGRPAEALRCLGVDGVCSLLALRITTGTARNVLPPRLQQCWRAFNEPHTPGSRLTVGARALTKHWSRSSERFWGASLDGSDAEKNINAVRVLARIVDDVMWLNVHALPHDTLVFEMRNSMQYGARWELSRDRRRCEFRGFLEPQLDDGHALGWRH
jgi:hypothetical protein